MKKAFLEDLKHMWPQGLHPSEKSQWRDIIRVYMMGWCSALMSQGAVEQVAEWTKEFRPLADPNWWPDDSWRWW